MAQAKKTTKKKKTSPIFRFFTIVFFTVFSFLVLASIVTASYLYIVKGTDRSNSNDPKQEEAEAEDSGIWSNIFNKKEKVKTNVAVFGVDEDEIRTDVIIVASFDSKTKKISLLSIPRDTRVTLTEERYLDMQSRNSHRFSKVMKINEVHAYAGTDYRNEYSVDEIERLLDIDIDYYVKINLKAFRKIVDIMGGVEVDVPRDMYYSDPYQNLYINLKKGKQKLNGAQAEQLVRFRKGYENGDVGRIQTQQIFLKAFIKQGLSERNILNAINIIQTLYEYVDTDFKIGDVPKYSKYIRDIKPENITMEALPGDSRYIDEISFFIPDEEKTKELVNQLFKEEDENTKISSKELSIEVLNASNTNGLAGQTKYKLENEGYPITSIGNYEGDKIEGTQIIVKQKEMGEDLLPFFESATIEVSPEKLPDDIDIQILLGIID